MSSYTSRYLLLPVATTIFILACALAPSAKDYEGVLQDPIVLGAWLYESKCVRCHNGYESARLASDFDDSSELTQAFGNGGCRVNWSRQAGGSLRQRELDAIASFMLLWEEEDQAPALPDLPPLETDKPNEVHRVKPKAEPVKKITELPEKEKLSAPLRHLINNNAIARGGWLYIQNCYRCHLTYEKARMGKGMEEPGLRRIIAEGKTSTQMKPFSRVLGGTLKNSEIKVIATYIKTWEEKGESLAIAPILMEPPAVDPADFVPMRLTRYRLIGGNKIAGQRLFQQNCATCHGPTGGGLLGPSFMKTLPSMRPDLYFKSVLKTGVPGSIMVTWDRNKAGTLSAKNIDDLVSYLMTLQRFYK